MITTIRLTDRLYLFQDTANCFANLVIGIASHGHFDHVGGSL